jgi:hypothetical protein
MKYCCEVLIATRGVSEFVSMNQSSLQYRCEDQAVFLYRTLFLQWTTEKCNPSKTHV